MTKPTTGDPTRRGAFAGPRAAMDFLTIVGRSTPPTPAALPWFGAVGAVVGLGVGGTYWLGLRLTSPFLAATIAIGVDLALTGLLHLDGLADSADGLLPPLDRARRLAVMKDPATGAFGVAAAVLVLLLRVAALAAAPAAPVVLAGVWALSRTTMAAIILSTPSARPGGGLAAAFTADPRARTSLIIGCAISAVASVALGFVGRGAIGAIAVIATVVGSMAVVAFARHRIGGYTGDVLGASGVIGETAALLLLAIR